MIEIAAMENANFNFQLVPLMSSMMPSVRIKAEDMKYDPITLSRGNKKGDIRSTPDAMAIPPNLGVGWVCICLLPGIAIAPLLFASDISRGTVANEIMKAIKKDIYKVMVMVLFSRHYFN